MTTFSPIELLIPQRPPILMVDELLRVEGDEAWTMWRVREGNCFLEADGSLSPVGLIEHIAQSAAALCGYRSYQQGAAEPSIAYLCEVKRFSCLRTPQVAEELTTHIMLGPSVDGVMLLTALCSSVCETVATTQMKICIP